MKNSRSVGAIAVFSLLFLFGCGKCGSKEEKKAHHEMAAAEMTEEMGTQQAMGENFDEYVFDDLSDDADFAFLDEDGDLLAADDSDDFYTTEELEAFMDDDDFALAWDDEQSEVASAQIKEDLEAVHFVYNYDWIEKSDGKKLNKLAKKAKEIVSEGKKLVLEGHCDQMGSAEINLPLSERRAQAMKKELVKRGVPAQNIEVVARGQECPLVESHEAERAKKIAQLAPNRRVEVKVATAA